MDFAGALGRAVADRYRIEREIGRGGMAVVYLARDLKHDRQVAIKVLPPEFGAGVAAARFLAEIRVTANLQHPHLLPLFDSGEAGGLLYYVMPYVEGESLRARLLREKQLPVEEAIRMAVAIARAVDHAHRQGVLHRDLKPENVLLQDGVPLVADFGIALALSHATDDRVTQTGLALGTPAYMSPEQAAGERVLDARADVYSLGAMLYEMLTGEPPHTGATAQAVIARALTERPRPVRATRSTVSQAVEAVVDRALAKVPADRFATAGEFADALGAATQDVRARRLAWRIPVVAGLVAAVAFGAWAVRARNGPASDRHSIAVLPFANLAADRTDEYFSDGVTEEITEALAQLGHFRVVPRTAAFAYKGRTGQVTQIGRDLGVTRVLEGSVRRDGSRLRVIATLVDAVTGERLWSQSYDRDVGAVLPLQAELAATIAEQLEVRLAPAERRRMAVRHSEHPGAYDSYLKGRYFFDQRTAASLTQAVGHFEQAIALDSAYARAYAGLADTYSILAWTGAAPPTELFQRSRRMALRAIALDSGVAEPHLSLGIINTFSDWDWDAAVRATTHALSIDSMLVAGWFFRTWPLIAAGRQDEAMASLQRARSLAPLSLITNARVGMLFAWRGQYAAADSAPRATLEIDATYPVARVQRARVLSLQGRHAEAIAALPPDTVMFGSYESGIAGFVYARAGRRSEALAAARVLEQRSFVPAEGVAAIYAGLGDTARALDWLERAVEARGVGLIFVAREPMYDVLRGAPRFERIVERVGVVK